MTGSGVQISNMFGDGGSNGIGAILLNNNMDFNALRPFVGYDGRTYVNRMVVNNQGQREMVAVLANNATGVLTKDQWIEIDRMIMTVGRPRLKLVSDIRSTPGLTRTIPNGLGTTVLQHQTMSDVGEAIISMSPGRQTRNDRPAFDLGSLPLPIVHSDVQFDIRDLAVSRSAGLNGLGMDLSNVEQATRRVSEKVERLAIGLESYAYGGGTVYGLINFPSRVSYSMTLPTAPGWTPATTVDEVLAMMQASRDIYKYGPWSLYTSPNWEKFMGADYSAAKGDNTLRERLLKLEGLNNIITLDYMTGYRMVLVQKESSTIQMVVGMEIVPIQWQVGVDITIKLMTIQVPRVRADYNGYTGIVDGLAA